jgi:hypothetical protein
MFFFQLYSNLLLFSAVDFHKKNNSASNQRIFTMFSCVSCDVVCLHTNFSFIFHIANQNQSTISVFTCVIDRKYQHEEVYKAGKTNILTCIPCRQQPAIQPKVWYSYIRKTFQYIHTFYSISNPNRNITTNE